MANHRGPATDLASHRTGPVSASETSSGPLAPLNGFGAHSSASGGAEDTPEPASQAQPARKQPKKATRAPKPHASTKSLALVLWTPISTRSRMQAVRASQGTSYLNQVLDALEGNVDQLPSLIASANTKPTIRGRLFVREDTTSQPAAAHRVQLTIRGVLKSQLEVLDQLVEETGAGSRSALCNAALDSWLKALE